MKKIALLIQKKICFLICAIVLAQHNTVAQETQNAPVNHERLYQVELIVFSRNDNNVQKETWPNNITLTYPNNVISLSPAGTNNPDEFTMLSNNERLLNTQAASIAKSGSYTLLFHQAWQQMIVAQKTSILINGGKTVNGHQELEGSIDLSVGQFLKLKTNLWLTQFSLRTEADTKNVWPELPLKPNSFTADTTSTTEPTTHYVSRIVKINQQRSMRSQEVHYIDHPLLGVIIKIIPVEPSNTKLTNTPIN